MKPKLNQNQEKAVTMDLGPAMILAGPGSGKTTVVLERIRHLIFEKHIDPKKILVITFTKSAALEMKERAASVIDAPFFGTFHSYFYMVLKRSNLYRHYSILPTTRKYRILENLLKTHYPNCRISQNFLSDILKCISKQKNDLDIVKDIDNLDFSMEDFEHLRETYDYFNRAEGYMDFDDILLYAWKLLQEDTAYLKRLQREITYILVDEFQDVNKIQYELICLLAGHRGNVFVVGDDDQSIYRFRGAGEENLRRFEQDFCGVQKVTLDINYRCPKKIVDASLKLIQNNKHRFFKNICSAKNEDGKIFCKVFENKDAEREYVLEVIRNYTVLDQNTDKNMDSYKSVLKNRKRIALLCRTNSQLGVFAELLRKEQISFIMKEKMISFYELPCIRPIIGYLMFATGVDRSRKILFSFLNQPIRYLKREYFTFWNEKNSRLSDAEECNTGMKNVLQKLQKELNSLAKLSPQMAVTYILKAMGYEEFKRNECRTKEEFNKLKENFILLKERAKMYTTLVEWMDVIKWEENMDLEAEDEKTEATERTTNLYLYTFHGAKGLEFDTVLIPHLNEGSVPYGKNLTEEELEEERRMFYVAMTRSRDTLYITYTENESKKDTASRFLKEACLAVSKEHIQSNAKK